MELVSTSIFTCMCVRINIVKNAVYFNILIQEHVFTDTMNSEPQDLLRVSMLIMVVKI